MEFLHHQFSYLFSFISKQRLYYNGLFIFGFFFFFVAKPNIKLSAIRLNPFYRNSIITFFIYWNCIINRNISIYIPITLLSIIYIILIFFFRFNKCITKNFVYIIYFWIRINRFYDKCVDDTIFNIISSLIRIIFNCI
jgi:hypothetical protein